MKLSTYVIKSWTRKLCTEFQEQAESVLVQGLARAVSTLRRTCESEAQARKDTRSENLRGGTHVWHR